SSMSSLSLLSRLFCVFFFSATPPPEIYTLSLHDASSDLGRASRLRRSRHSRHAGADLGEGPTPGRADPAARARRGEGGRAGADPDRKSTRLNSSHVEISYAVFCLKKKTAKKQPAP